MLMFPIVLCAIENNCSAYFIAEEQTTSDGCIAEKKQFYTEKDGSCQCLDRSYSDGCKHPHISLTHKMYYCNATQLDKCDDDTYLKIFLQSNQFVCVNFCFYQNVIIANAPIKKYFQNNHSCDEQCAKDTIVQLELIDKNDPTSINFKCRNKTDNDEGLTLEIGSSFAIIIFHQKEENGLQNITLGGQKIFTRTCTELNETLTNNNKIFFKDYTYNSLTTIAPARKRNSPTCGTCYLINRTENAITENKEAICEDDSPDNCIYRKYLYSDFQKPVYECVTSCTSYFVEKQEKEIYCVDSCENIEFPTEIKSYYYHQSNSNQCVKECPKFTVKNTKLWCVEKCEKLDAQMEIPFSFSILCADDCYNLFTVQQEYAVLCNSRQDCSFVVIAEKKDFTFFTRSDNKCREKCDTFTQNRTQEDMFICESQYQYPFQDKFCNVAEILQGDEGQLICVQCLANCNNSQQVFALQEGCYVCSYNCNINIDLPNSDCGFKKELITENRTCIDECETFYRPDPEEGELQFVVCIQSDTCAISIENSSIFQPCEGQNLKQCIGSCKKSQLFYHKQSCVDSCFQQNLPYQETPNENTCQSCESVVEEANEYKCVNCATLFKYDTIFGGEHKVCLDKCEGDGYFIHINNECNQTSCSQQNTYQNINQNQCVKECDTQQYYDPEILICYDQCQKDKNYSIDKMCTNCQGDNEYLHDDVCSKKQCNDDKKLVKIENGIKKCTKSCSDLIQESKGQYICQNKCKTQNSYINQTIYDIELRVCHDCTEYLDPSQNISNIPLCSEKCTDSAYKYYDNYLSGSKQCVKQCTSQKINFGELQCYEPGKKCKNTKYYEEDGHKWCLSDGKCPDGKTCNDDCEQNQYVQNGQCQNDCNLSEGFFYPEFGNICDNNCQYFITLSGKHTCKTVSDFEFVLLLKYTTADRYQVIQDNNNSKCKFYESQDGKHFCVDKCEQFTNCQINKLDSCKCVPKCEPEIYINETKYCVKEQGNCKAYVQDLNKIMCFDTCPIQFSKYIQDKDSGPMHCANTCKELNAYNNDTNKCVKSCAEINLAVEAEEHKCKNCQDIGVTKQQTEYICQDCGIFELKIIFDAIWRFCISQCDLPNYLHTNKECNKNTCGQDEYLSIDSNICIQDCNDNYYDDDERTCNETCLHEKKYYIGKKCTECKGLNEYLHAGGCKAEKCSPDLFVERDEVKVCVTNCKDEGWYLHNGRCVDSCSSNSLSVSKPADSDNVCSNCSSTGIQEAQVGVEYICVNCAALFKYDTIFGGKHKVCLDTCEGDGYFIHKENECSQQQCSHSKQYQPVEGNNCTDQCHPDFTDIEDSKCLVNCNTSKSYNFENKTCTTCNGDGYFKDEQKCVQKCGSNFYNVSSMSCVDSCANTPVFENTTGQFCVLKCTEFSVQKYTVIDQSDQPKCESKCPQPFYDEQFVCMQVCNTDYVLHRINNETVCLQNKCINNSLLKEGTKECYEQCPNGYVKNDIQCIVQKSVNAALIGGIVAAVVVIIIIVVVVVVVLLKKKKATPTKHKKRIQMMENEIDTTPQEGEKKISIAAQRMKQRQLYSQVVSSRSTTQNRALRHPLASPLTLMTVKSAPSNPLAAYLNKAKTIHKNEENNDIEEKPASKPRRQVVE